LRLRKIGLILLTICIFFILGACEKDPVTPKPKDTVEKTETKTTADTSKTTTKKSTASVDQKTPSNVQADDQPSKSSDQKKSVKVQSSEKEEPTTSKSSEPEKQEKADNPTPKPKAAPPVKKSGPEVIVEVIGYQGDSVLAPTRVSIREGETILDATTKILKTKGISYKFRGSGATAYMEGIADQFEFDHGGTSGWTILLNGKRIDRSSGVVKVHNGDRITWKYTTQLEGNGG
jgi:hypothetical protein